MELLVAAIIVAFSLCFCIQELKRELQCHQQQLQITDLQQHIKHMSHLISVQDQENTQTHKYESTLVEVLHQVS